MATIKYKSPFAPYPFVDSATVTATPSTTNNTMFNLGDLVQLKGTNEVYRLVTFDNTASADVDFAADILCFKYNGWESGGTFTVRQDVSDCGEAAGICPHAIDISALSGDVIGWIQVGGEAHVTNHDTTCPLGAPLSSGQLDAGTFDVSAAGEAIIAHVVNDEGTATPVVDLCLPGVMPVPVNG